MSKELLLVAEALSNEKGVNINVVFEAIQTAIETATRKLCGAEWGVRVSLDTRSGDYTTYRFWDVVADDALEFPDHQLTLDQANEKQVNIKVGERIEEVIDSIEFGRIAAQTARQVILQKVREAERNLVIDQYRHKLGGLVHGTVKKVTKDYLIVDLGGKAEAFLPRNEMLPQEMYRLNDRVRALLYEIMDTVRGPQLMLSRTRTEMLTALFCIEVPEIGENIIQIKAAAREPGIRAKIAVKTNDGRIDPVGACVGMRGSRVQAVSSELGGERVDIILWDDNPAQMVINAMAPAEISSIVVDEDSHTMDLAVQQDQLSQAIGRNGQNVRLASQLTAWTLNVMSVADLDGKNQAENERAVELFTVSLDIDKDLAQLLVQNGFSSIEEIAYVPKDELMEIQGFDEEIVEELRNRANTGLIAQALSLEGQVAENLMQLDGMTLNLAQELSQKGIHNLEELAECGLDELIDIPGISAEKAGQWIMKAREPWFKENE
ncbi:MAG: transcription termination/antitermination protein NusA [Gammaproteobacteria bacterium]|nr:transcription termination/antitermination protein NusA [Gammaproteobacteria bacterium]